MDDIPSYHETSSYQTLQDQINEIMSKSHPSSQSMSEELCPLLLAQNAHLQSLLRQKHTETSQITDKHLDIAAEGIREQSQVIIQLKESNNQFKNQQNQIQKKIEKIFVEICLEKLPEDEISSYESFPSDINDQLEILSKSCKTIIINQEKEIKTLKKQRKNYFSKKEKDDDNYINLLDEEDESYETEEEDEDDEEQEIEIYQQQEENQQNNKKSKLLDSKNLYLMDFDNQQKILQCMEENQYQSQKIQNLWTENHKISSIITKLLQEIKDISRYYQNIDVDDDDESSLSSPISYLKPTKEEIEEISKEILFLHDQINEITQNHKLFSWCGILSQNIQCMYNDNMILVDKINNLLKDNDQLLEQCEILVQESSSYIQIIDSLQNEISTTKIPKENQNQNENQSSNDDHFDEINSNSLQLIEKIRSIHGNSAVLISPDILNKQNNQNKTKQEEKSLHSSFIHENQIENHQNHENSNSKTWFHSMIQIQKNKEEKEELLDQIDCSTKEIQFWQEKANQLKKQMNKLLSECSCVSIQENYNSFEIEDENDDDDDDDQQQNVSSSIISSYKDEITTLTSIVSNLTENNENLKNQNENQFKEFEKLKIEFNELQNQYERQQKSLQIMTKKLASQQMNSNSDLITQKQNIIQQLCQQRDDLTKQVKKLKQNLKNNEQEKQLLQENLKFYDSKQKSFSSPSLSSSSSYSHHYDEINEALHEMETENSLYDISSLRSRLSETLKQNKFLLEKLVSMDCFSWRDFYDQIIHLKKNISRFDEFITILHNMTKYNHNELFDDDFIEVINDLIVITKDFLANFSTLEDSLSTKIVT